MITAEQARMIVMEYDNNKETMEIELEIRDASRNGRNSIHGIYIKDSQTIKFYEKLGFKVERSPYQDSEHYTEYNIYWD